MPTLPIQAAARATQAISFAPNSPQSTGRPTNFSDLIQEKITKASSVVGDHPSEKSVFGEPQSPSAAEGDESTTQSQQGRRGPASSHALDGLQRAGSHVPGNVLLPVANR